MNDYPDYGLIVFNPTDLPVSWSGFPHRVALLPDGHTFAELQAKPQQWATFLVEPDSINEVLSGNALPAYLERRVPVLIHARRARDLRPILRRAEALARRGYTVAALAAPGSLA
jgi:hypothetical protein